MAISQRRIGPYGTQEEREAVVNALNGLRVLGMCGCVAGSGDGSHLTAPNTVNIREASRRLTSSQPEASGPDHACQAGWSPNSRPKHHRP